MIKIGIKSVVVDYLPGESKKVSAFGGQWNKKYVTDIQN